jgi:predicted PurR-regulated permease PerM
VEVLGQQLSARTLAVRFSAAVAAALGNPGGALHAVRLAVELVLELLLVLITVAYLLVDGRRLGKFLLRFIPPEHRDRVECVAGEIHVVLGRYLRGQLLLIGLVSLVTFGALEWLFHLPHALPIAIATGVVEVVPLLGPLLAAGIACAVAFAHGGPHEAGLVALTYLVIRQAEDQLVMPIVVGRAVHVHPLVTIFAVVVGGRIAGILGALLAVPSTAAAKVVLDYAYPPVGGAQEAAGRPARTTLLQSCVNRLRRRRAAVGVSTAAPPP